VLCGLVGISTVLGEHAVSPVSALPALGKRPFERLLLSNSASPDFFLSSSVSPGAVISPSYFAPVSVQFSPHPYLFIDGL
jgi:hypothetical protein